MTSTDPLLRPTLQQVRPGARPWRLGSQGYVAFIGGSLAGTAVAVVNAGRLGLPRSAVLRIAAVGAVALAAGVALPAVAGGRLGDLGPALLRLPAVAAYLVQARVQRGADRAFALGGGEHAPLLRTGLAAVVVLGLLELALAVAVAGAVR